MQVALGAQSAFDLHVPLHAFVPQANGKQSFTAGVVQAPAPLQVDCAVKFSVPTGHVEPLQDVPIPYFWHAPATQRPFVPHEAAPWSTQMAFGSIVLVGTFVHVPSEVGRLHDLHEALQVVTQQTPCAHTVEAHSVPAEQLAPGPLRPHELLMQVLGGEQFAETVHDGKHLVPLHAKGAHGVDPGATHWPVLLQVDGPVYMLVAHFSPAHCVPTAYLLQPPAPSQRPFVPHEAAPWSTQTARLSSVPCVSEVHVPFDDVSAQLRHAPPQATLQQTPSVQKPDAQSPAFVHVPPFSFNPQLWFTHAMPATQSASVVHDGLHAPDTQRNGVQSCSPGGLHVPTPSQVPAVLRRSPAHDGSEHTVSAAYFAHAPKPSHAPVCPQLVAPMSLQTLRGSGLPASMGQHVPKRPVWLHVWHGPWHESAQQTPSVQKPESHSSFFEQLMPFILRPQLPLAHVCPDAQSLLVVQVEEQSCVVGSHVNGAQTFASPGAHVPLPSQVWMPVTAAPLHVPLTQMVPATYLRHAPCPSHVPSSPHVRTSPVGQVVAARGFKPSGTNEHVPIAPGTLHALHVSPHAVSQQTPSAQNPDWQSAPHPHGCPMATRALPSHFGGASTRASAAASG